MESLGCGPLSPAEYSGEGPSAPLRAAAVITPRGPNLGGSLGVFIYYSWHFFPVLYVRNQRRRPQSFSLWSKRRNSLHVELAELKQLKWNGPLQTQLWSQGPPGGGNCLLKIDCSSGTLFTLTFWHFETRVKASNQLIYTQPQYGGSVWPFPLRRLMLTIRGSSRGSLAHCLFFFLG